MKIHRPLLGFVPAAMLAAQLTCGCSDKPQPARTPQPLQTTNDTPNVMVCAPGSFMNGVECIPIAELQCPTGTASKEGQCVPVDSGSDSDPVNETARELVKSVAADVRMENVLDSRTFRSKPRPRALLITELQGLESLFASIAKVSPDRPRVMRRLAEGYVELSASAGRDVAAAVKPDERSRAEKIEQAARQAAIKYYTLLSNQYPKFCGAPISPDPSKSQGCDDEVVYYLAVEHMRAKQLDNARKSFLSLVQRYPTSEYIGHAYFAFGEMFRDEAAGDPSKWSLAEQSYLEAVKYPRSPIVPAALLRLGDVFEKQGNGAKARSFYKKLLAQFPTSDAAAHVPDSMR